jgi:hypothetical protein
MQPTLPILRGRGGPKGGEGEREREREREREIEGYVRKLLAEERRKHAMNDEKGHSITT